MSTVERSVGSAGQAVSRVTISARRVLSVVIPTYNEQDNMRRVYERLARALEVCSWNGSSSSASTHAPTARRS